MHSSEEQQKTQEIQDLLNMLSIPIRQLFEQGDLTLEGAFDLQFTSQHDNNEQSSYFASSSVSSSSAAISARTEAVSRGVLSSELTNSSKKRAAHSSEQGTMDSLLMSEKEKYEQSKRIKHLSNLIEAGLITKEDINIFTEEMYNFYCFCTPWILYKNKSYQEVLNFKENYDSLSAIMPLDFAACLVAIGKTTFESLSILQLESLLFLKQIMLLYISGIITGDGINGLLIAHDKEDAHLSQILIVLSQISPQEIEFLRVWIFNNVEGFKTEDLSFFAGITPEQLMRYEVKDCYSILKSRLTIANESRLNVKRTSTPNLEDEILSGGAQEDFSNVAVTGYQASLTAAKSQSRAHATDMFHNRASSFMYPGSQIMGFNYGGDHRYERDLSIPERNLNLAPCDAAVTAPSFNIGGAGKPKAERRRRGAFYNIGDNSQVGEMQESISGTNLPTSTNGSYTQLLRTLFNEDAPNLDAVLEPQRESEVPRELSATAIDSDEITDSCNDEQTIHMTF